MCVRATIYHLSVLYWEEKPESADYAYFHLFSLYILLRGGKVKLQ